MCSANYSGGVYTFDATTISYLLRFLVMERFILTKVWQNTSAAASNKTDLEPNLHSCRLFSVTYQNCHVQGEDNVLVLQTEDIVRLVLKIHENDTNIIWLFFKNAYFLKVTWV